uniref:Uncharacterized protein n=1 Tax=Oryza nivara TaxID=4536 RepID=A0A0E0G5Z4_ORYNI
MASSIVLLFGCVEQKPSRVALPGAAQEATTRPPLSPTPTPFSASPSPERPPAKPCGRKDGGGGAILVSSRSGGLGSRPEWRRRCPPDPRRSGRIWRGGLAAGKASAAGTGDGGGRGELRRVVLWVMAAGMATVLGWRWWRPRIWRWCTRIRRWPEHAGTPRMPLASSGASLGVGRCWWRGRRPDLAPCPDPARPQVGTGWLESGRRAGGVNIAGILGV